MVKSLVDNAGFQDSGDDFHPNQPITRPLFPEAADTIVHTEKGQVKCICPATQEIRDLAFSGFEADRNTLKYRCPATSYGFDCADKDACHARSKKILVTMGVLSVSISPSKIGVFLCLRPTAVHRGSEAITAAVRWNASIAASIIAFCFEKHFIRGQVKMQTRMGLALAVMMVMALGHVKENREQQMRFLIRPIPCAASG
jgi:hypothetical protein